MNRLLLPVVFLSFCFSTSLIRAEGFKDDFSNPKLEIRQALRGEWVYKDGVASCVSDPELYKQYANHGPILRWPAEFTDGSVELEFKPQGCQRVVITLNEEGHVFRVMLSDKSRAFGWIGISSKENTAKPIASEGLPTLPSLENQWTKFKLVTKGDTGHIQIGDYTATLHHGSIGRKKGEFTISFASGECAFRNVKGQWKPQ